MKRRFTDLRFTDLRFTDLRFTEIRFTNLRFTEPVEVKRPPWSPAGQQGAPSPIERVNRARARGLLCPPLPGLHPHVETRAVRELVEGLI